MRDYIITIEDWFFKHVHEQYTHFFGCPIEEIVRCRDCRYYEPDGEPSAVDASWHWCDRMMHYLEPDGFCKWGRMDA